MIRTTGQSLLWFADTSMIFNSMKRLLDGLYRVRDFVSHQEKLPRVMYECSDFYERIGYCKAIMIIINGTREEAKAEFQYLEKLLQSDVGGYITIQPTMSRPEERN